MRWIDHGSHSQKRQALLTDTGLYVFYPGEHGLDEIREMIKAGTDPDTLIVDSGEKYPRESIEFIAYDPGNASLKIHRWSATDNANRFINKISPDEAMNWLKAIADEWNDYTLVEKEHGKLGRLIIPGAALIVILFFAAGFWWSLGQGGLENPDAPGRWRLRLVLITMAKVFRTTGKPGIALAAVLCAAYPLVVFLKVLRGRNPTLMIAHRNDISVGAGEAVDRTNPNDPEDLI